MAQSIDIRKLVMMVNEQKKLNAQLALEFDCIIEIEDPKALVQVINYIINFCGQLSEKAPYISLNDQMDEFLLSFSVNTEATELPPFNEKVIETVKEFDARMEIKLEPGKYARIIIAFS